MAEPPIQAPSPSSVPDAGEPSFMTIAFQLFLAYVFPISSFLFVAAVMFLVVSICDCYETREWRSKVARFLNKIPHGIYVVPSSPSRLPSTSDDVPEHQLHHCVICMEEYAGGEQLWVMPACKHVFHEACIKQWLLEPALTCPICRDHVIHVEATTSGGGDDDDDNIETPLLVGTQ
ncbi:unnamed protein product [Musa acuminata subsp. malaccensis]|uniref:(wild Malaysian banana) hypothetical protein n=1 Tax=Musa acuminata subsp. malaccensis TaxID=214687 RepID=A0A804HQ33_MUSAM|nr:PREDICTED: RING-H2 finger protein ATL56-like [Musa acuminata subsp. malaccensis]CAG1858503.1 unnamed protein product [Musa acuminata subsp. malaccensis]